MEASNELEDRPEVLFSDSIKNLRGENFLGDRVTIQSTLRYVVGQVCDKIEGEEDGHEINKEIKPWAKWLAKVFLGQNRDYRPLRNWNEPGAIDVFCAKWVGSSETDPNLRMEHVFVKFFSELLDLAEYAGDDAVLDEQWLFQMDLILENYTALLLGIDPATQKTIILEDEEPGEDDGSQE